MKKQTFIMGAIILTIGGFVAKVIGAFYKIPLTNILGSSGMGIYYLVFPLYNLMLVFSSSGITVAVTKLVARERIKNNKKNETTYFKAGILLSLTLSFVFSIIMLLFASKLAYAQGNVLSKLGFVAISPAIISASIVSVVKGYFQGVENMIPSSIAMIVEQIVKLVFGLFLSYRLLPYGIEYSVMGAVLAVSISETVTLLIMLINYAWHKRKDNNLFYRKSGDRLKKIEIKQAVKQKISLTNFKKIKKSKYYFTHEKELIGLHKALRETIKETFPNTLMSLVTPLISLIDSFVVINLLTASGFSSYSATSLYGLNNGVVGSLISLPVIITSSLSTAVVPNLSGLMYANNAEKISDRISFFIKITWIIALPIFVYFLIMPDEIINALYKFSSHSIINEFGFASNLLRVSSITILYNAMLSTIISILQSIDKPYKTFFILFVSMGLRTILSFILIRNLKINIFGIVIANVFFLSLALIGCVGLLKKHVKLNLNIKKFIFTPIFVSIVSGVLTYICSLIFTRANVWITLLASGVVLAGSYVLLIFALKSFENYELKFFRKFKNK